MNVSIKTIPFKDARYPTIGDYFDKDGVEYVHVCDTGNELYNKLISIHELIEKWLTEVRGVSELEILAFDKHHEAMMTEGEPGDHKKSPYKKEHRFAENIERLVCAEFGIDWNEYDKYIEDFFYKNLTPKQINTEIGK